MFDSKTQILAVVGFTTCVVVIWRSKTNSVEKSKFCLEDNTITKNLTKDNILPLIIDMNDSTMKSSASSTVPTKINFKRDNNNRKDLKIPLDSLGRESERPIVKTSSGLVEGKRLKILGSNVLAFLGIPY